MSEEHLPALLRKSFPERAAELRPVEIRPLHKAPFAPISNSLLGTYQNIDYEEIVDGNLANHAILKRISSEPGLKVP